MWSTVPWLSINKSNIHLFSSPRCALFPTIQIITRARSPNNQTVTIMWKMIREQNNPTNNHSAIWHLTINQIAIAGLQISIKMPKINHRLGSDQSQTRFGSIKTCIYFIFSSSPRLNLRFSKSINLLQNQNLYFSKSQLFYFFISISQSAFSELIASVASAWLIGRAGGGGVKLENPF